jgi:hypothetical protein
MRFFYFIAIVIMVAVVIGWAALPPKHIQPVGPPPDVVQMMNSINPEFIPYSTLCFKGMKLIRIQNSYFYELDDNGKPIRCVR